MVDILEHSDIVEQVVADLNVRLTRFEEEADPREIFTLIYKQITEGILTKLLDQQSNQGFDDPHWLAELDRTFAQYYLEALDAFDRNDSTTPKVWQAVFEAIGAGKSKTYFRLWDVLKALLLSMVAHISILKAIFEAFGLGKSWDVLKALLLPMVAHIMHDLVLALDDSKAAPANEFDHEQVTDLLCKEIDNVQETEARFAPLLALLDEAAQNLNETFTCYVVRRMRQQAWADAQALRAAQNDEEKRAAIKKSVEEKTLRVIHKIRTSPLKLLDVLNQS